MFTRAATGWPAVLALLSVLLLVLSFPSPARANTTSKEQMLLRFSEIRKLIGEGELIQADQQLSAIEVSYDDYPDWLGEYYLTSAHLLFAKDPTNMRAIRAELGLAQMDLAYQSVSPAYVDAWLLQLRLNASDRDRDSVMKQIGEVVNLAIHYEIPELAVEALLFGADVARRDGYPLLGFENLKRAAEIVDSRKDPRLEAELALAYGKFYGHALILDRSLMELGRAEQFFKQHGPRTRYIDSQIALAESYLIAGERKTARAYFMIADSMATSSQLAAQQLAAAKGLAILLLFEGQPAQAADYVELALSLSEADADRFEVLKIALKLALDQGDTSKAQTLMKQTRAVWEQLPKSKQISLSGIDVWLLQAQLASLQGDPDISWDYVEAYLHLRDDAINARSGSGIESLLVENSVDRLSDHNQQLKSSNQAYQAQLSAAEEQQKLQHRINLLAALILVMLLAFGIRVGMERRRLRYLADTDGLTGLVNRRAGVTRCKHWIEQNPSKPFAVILFDIDYFKKINDNFGHQTGDEVLEQFASITRGFSRKSDILARFGGEEFLLALPDCDIETAAKRAEELRDEFEHTDFTAHLRVTASFGVAVAPGASFEKLYEAADKALYQAKIERNQVCISAARQLQQPPPAAA